MGSGIRRSYFELPSIRSFLDGIANAITDRRSALVLLPRYVDDEKIISEIQRLLYGLDLDTSTIDVGSLVDQQPVEVFHSWYPAKWESIQILRSARTYLERVELEYIPDVIILDGIEKLPVLQRDEWMQFLAAWADASHHLKNDEKRPPALCVVARAEDILSNIPNESYLFLTVHWWWNIPSILEMKMLCRVTNMQDNESNCLSEWRENIIPSLALGNLDLIEFLWNIVGHDREKLINELREYACQLGADLMLEESTQDLIQERDKRFQPIPLPRIRAYWAKGSVCSSPEHGIEISTLALAQMGMHDELRHRIWRAQVDLLLPQIDNVRLVVCKYLTKTKGTAWPHKWSLPNSEKELIEVQQNPLVTDLGYLKHLISQDSHFKDCSQFRRLINISHELRNQIAHYQEISFTEYQVFVEEHLTALP